MRAAVFALGALFIATPLMAQGDCFPRSNSREADLFAHFSTPLAFSNGAAPTLYNPGAVLIGVEATMLPDASDRIATPTTCRPGKGPENVNILPGFIRPRLGYSLGNGNVLEISWVPPIEIDGVKANLWSFAVSRSVLLNPRGAVLMGRVHGTIGHVRAPFVCGEGDIDEPGNECEGTEISNDKYSPNIFGVELGVGWAWAGGRLRPYLGGGYNILHPRFQVDHEEGTGEIDDRKVEVNLSRWVVFGGLTLQATPRFALSAEGYSSPSDNITARAKLSYALGGYSGRR
ncbi:MAG TPA: hypothetical protein VG817_07860 [Gemmatimonadales bacterium]|nr:hypothetical protein [Gemmatimonadales bacterium]